MENNAGSTQARWDGERRGCGSQKLLHVRGAGGRHPVDPTQGQVNEGTLPLLHHPGTSGQPEQRQLSLQSSSQLQKHTEANLSQMSGGTGTLKLVTEVGVGPDIETECPSRCRHLSGS